MTKEEHLELAPGNPDEYKPIYSLKEAEQAMDTYARQEAIAFNRYCGGLPIDFHNRHTLEELYDLYQQQKTQP